MFHQQDGGNTVEYIFGDVIRRELKIHNLGMKAVKLIDDVIKRAKDKGFEFESVQDYEQNHR